MAKAPVVDKDQLKIPIVIRCACPCRRVIQVEPGANGRPRRYFADSCRKVSERLRKGEAERVRQQAAYEAEARRVAAEADEARAILRDRRDVAEAAWVWRRVFGNGWQKLTVKQVFAIRDAFDAMARGHDVHVLDGNPAALMEGGYTRGDAVVPASSSRPEEADEAEPAELDDDEDEDLPDENEGPRECPYCEETRPDVRRRPDRFRAELDNDPAAEVVCCDDCDKQRAEAV